MILTLKRLVKRQVRNSAVLVSISLFSFAFCHHPGVRAFEAPVVATPLSVDHPYYEATREVRRGERALADVVAPALTGELVNFTFSTMVDGLEEAQSHLESFERDYFPQERRVRISSRFGMRFHPVYHRWKLHNGVDFAAPQGTPVRAVSDGVVLSAGWNGAAGRLVKIDHGDFVSGYAHLSRFQVRAGQTVHAGELLGAVGSSGASTGPHLHFTIQKNGRFVDPLHDGLSRIEPIEEAQVLVNVERGLGLTARVLGGAAQALFATADITAPEVEDLLFDDSFL